MAIGFKHGSSGGGDLFDFTVVKSSTQPTDPKENTIWVNGDYSNMGSWDICPTEPHRVSRTDNLIVYPYLNGTKTVSGVTFTDLFESTGDRNDRGKISVSGTNSSSGTIVYRLSDSGIAKRELLLQPGTYYLSGNCESSSSTTHRLLLVYSYDDWATRTTVNELTNNGKFTLEKVAKARISIQISGGKTVTNAVYQPMLEKDSKGVAYTMGNATGQVWIKTDPNSTILMDAVKGKNNIAVPLGSAYEYATHDGWVSMASQIYQNGEWKPLEVAEAPWDGYYFKDGEQYTDITGGWSTDGWNNSGTATIGSTIAVSSPGASQSAVVSTKNTVDLTDAKTLYFDSPNGANGYSSGYLCVTSEKSVATEADIKASVAIKAGRGSLDVSSLSGKYYICLFAHNQSYADVSAVWME